jgi:serine/threonine-protein kinase
MAGWCNGSAGFVHVWLAAAESLDGEFRELAEQCAWHAWEDNSADDLTLCCGVAGRAYALLAWYRDCGDASWLRRASDLVAEVTAALPRSTDLDPALLKGHLSLALIERELDHPHFARMPLFEAEGWPMRVSLRRRLRHNA